MSETLLKLEEIVPGSCGAADLLLAPPPILQERKAVIELRCGRWREREHASRHFGKAEQHQTSPSREAESHCGPTQ